MAYGSSIWGGGSVVSPQFCARACFDLYDYPDEPKSTPWSYKSPDNADCYYGVCIVGDTVLVAFRGATTLHDFLHALDFFSEKMLHFELLTEEAITSLVPRRTDDNIFHYSKLGAVNAGAWGGLDEALREIITNHNPASIQFTGHSLGAMRATLATALFNASFGTVKPRVVFGEPMSCFETGAKLADIEGSHAYLTTDGAAHDPIWGYPFWPPQYVHATKPAVLNVEPRNMGLTIPSNFPGIMALHYMGVYLSAIDPHWKPNVSGVKC